MQWPALRARSAVDRRGARLPDGANRQRMTIAIVRAPWPQWAPVCPSRAQPEQRIDFMNNRHAHRIVTRRRVFCTLPALAVLASLAAALQGCVATPPAPPPAAPMPTPIEAAVRSPTCTSCEDQTREIARLKQELATREAELRDLRSSQRDQVKVLQESTREVTRAKVRLRRLATQAEAASYIAEVEVAMATLRSSLGAKATPPLMMLAQGILASTAAPFAQGNYGAAMESAAQAEQLLALVAHYEVRPGSRDRVPGEVPLQLAIPLRVNVVSPLRRQPLARSPVVDTVKKDVLVVARAYKSPWMQVETDDGRAGWVEQRRLGPR
jgi:hypothetical protein